MFTNILFLFTFLFFISDDIYSSLFKNQKKVSRESYSKPKTSMNVSFKKTINSIKESNFLSQKLLQNVTKVDSKIKEIKYDYCTPEILKNKETNGDLKAINSSNEWRTDDDNSSDDASFTDSTHSSCSTPKSSPKRSSLFTKQV